MALFIRRQMPRWNEGKKKRGRYHYSPRHRIEMAKHEYSVPWAGNWLPHWGGWKKLPDGDLMDLLMRGA